MKISYEFGFVASSRSASRKRSFLFLQGVCSPFFACLADRLQAEGHRVFKVNFNAGDAAYWGRRQASSFRGSMEGLPEFLARHYADHGITDQILFGDCRPVHQPAVRQGRASGIRTHVFEEGYFRPHWVTLEREGVNVNSLIPRDPEWFRASAARLPEVLPVRPFPSTFGQRAFHDVAYHLAGALNPLLFSGYRTHAPVNAAMQYLGYAKRLPMLRLHARRDEKLLRGLIRRPVPFFFLPLQLDGDAQIRHHSPFAGMREVMARVLQSFALHAPADAHLLIKNHPLDPGLVNHGAVARELAAGFGLKGRVHFIETGAIGTILKFAQGTVTVNSTAGSVSLSKGCPTVCLADPVYNLPGLTFQGGLDAFWRERPIPDPGLFDCFRRTVIHSTQINGGFYSPEGISLAVENAMPRLLAERSPLEVLA